MKQTFTILLFLFFVTVKGQDIRNSFWGDSITAVKNSSQQDFKQATQDGIDLLFQEAKVGEMTATIAYLFIDNKLFKVRYIFEDKHADEESYMNDYLKVKQNLDDKYGKTEMKSGWANNLYRRDPGKYGFAVSIGHVIFQDSRETGTTKIDHIIQGDNYEITHVIDYVSKTYAHLWEDRKKAKNSKDF